MEEIRCGGCRKLLMKAAARAILGAIDIKCPRCGTMNCLRPAAAVPVKPAQDRLERP
ncbi:zinc finger domain-containing protein [Roseibium aquae]|uniref:zinc finger domain-containing protein n=1 Tax=Roseibium aquae TaxID=1323746 RepID=UPI00123D420C